MKSAAHLLGIDVGSVSVSVAEIDTRGKIVRTAGAFHHGDIVGSLVGLIGRFDLALIDAVAATSATPSLVKADARYDDRLCVMGAVRRLHGQAGAILNVGGERFSLITFDEEGNYLNCRTNSSCAAGTGSFLDQQVRRLNLPDIETLASLALDNRGAVPQIASRCAVFAKTDLVHFQQEGFTLEEICDGLCAGLARNIVDILFAGTAPLDPIVFVGGVAKNLAVANHIEAFIGKKLSVNRLAPFFGAIGAALSALADGCKREKSILCADDLFLPDADLKTYFHSPLVLKHSIHPDFSGIERYEETVDGESDSFSVEVDIYEELPLNGSCEAFLGIDVGSTSTKAALMSKDGTLLAGFYTRTAGRPVAATQRIFAAVEGMEAKKSLNISVIGAGTTGSGRKFIGKIIRADMISDEITAHARAAVEIRPDADTVIEIGGQDSKFTTLKDGAVTFSVMNNVCAAGTGSFMEEQAQRLGCSLADYAARVERRSAPITSDRCTVFMERDINHYLGSGYNIDEVLAAALHAITENYLTKVAVEAAIGNTVLFQGATAKNRALVAAFERRLDRPIHVSKFCHLTGAWGIALLMADANVRQSRFRGFGLHRDPIPVTSEVCHICNNRCKITVADIDGGKEAFGFMCGRDYDARKFVNNNTAGFDLLKERKRFFAPARRPEAGVGIKIGLPAALHLTDELPLWERFFARLGIRTVTSEEYREGIREGKRLAQAEFCAPMAAMHGHVRWLIPRCDYVFVPFFLEKRSGVKGLRRQYCYYTQFAPALVRAVAGRDNEKQVLTPLIHYLYSVFNTKMQLYRMISAIDPGKSFFSVAGAYDEAVAFHETARAKWRALYAKMAGIGEDVHVVLMGRPYTVLSEEMNKGIPGMFGALGIRAFFQDMLEPDPKATSEIAPLLKEVHWNYAAKILEAAAIVAGTRGAYPVFVTSFKCSPDSFILDYFRKIMDDCSKPYLILQLDEHDSRVGYETRIEAAVRTFRSHHALVPRPATAGEQVQVVRSFKRLRRFRSMAAESLDDLRQLLPWQQRPTPRVTPLSPIRRETLEGRTLILPNWDDITSRLVTANLREAGIDARFLPETDAAMRKSLRLNTGQCIPIHIIAQEFIDYVEEQGLDPAHTALWVVTGAIACNLRLYPYHIKSILNAHGKGMEKAMVYAGSISMADISVKLPLGNYLAYMFGGLVRRMGCRIRPYERDKGAADAAILRSVALLEEAFLGHRAKEDTVREVVSLFEEIPRMGGGSERRPKVAIFGDLYARDNDMINQNLIHFIEEQGGEVITTPYTTYAKMIAGPYMRKWLIEGHYLSVLSGGAIMAAVASQEKIYYRYFQKILKEPEPEFDEDPEDILAPYGLRIEHTGESMDNLLKVHYIKKYHPDVALFVQASPAFCCPSLVTEAMTRRIEAITGVPVVSITYDGTGGSCNDAVIPYLKYPRRSIRPHQRF